MSTTLSTPASVASSSQSTGAKFLLCAGAAMAADLITKQLAISALSSGAVVLSKSFSLMLVFNTGAAGGVSLGAHTALINIVTTALTILLVAVVVAPLARVHSGAAAAMGLIAGGAAGNLASLLLESRGVPDFLALQIPGAVIVFNVADIALWVGALMLVPVIVALVRAVRAERRLGAAARAAVAA